jgi:hypothetical protein
MNWEAIGVAAEVVGATGVIVTLAYLAVQIRQNTNQLQGEAINTNNEAQITILRDFRDDMELVAAYVKCATDWESGSAQEQLRVHAHILAYVLNFETAYNLWVTGALPERIYKTREDLVVSVLSPKGMRVWWEMWKGVFDPEFANRIGEKANAHDAPNIVEMTPFLNIEYWE